MFLAASGLAVIAIGGRQLYLALKERARAVPDVDVVSARAVCGRFVGLTALNPMTLVYFAALGGAVTVRTGSWAGPSVFVLAVGLASLAWQLVLAAVGSMFRDALGPTTARVIGIAASVLVLVLGVGVLLEGIGAFG